MRTRSRNGTFVVGIGVSARSGRALAVATGSGLAVGVGSGAVAVFGCVVSLLSAYLCLIGRSACARPLSSRRCSSAFNSRTS